MSRLAVAILTAMLVTGAASALVAQESEPRMHKGKQMMEKMDTDGNGELSRDEFMQAHEKMFDAVDENGDGTLDREELAAMKQRMRHHKNDDMNHHEKTEDMDHE